MTEEALEQGTDLEPAVSRMDELVQLEADEYERLREYHGSRKSW